MPMKKTGNRPMRGFRPDECFDALLKMYGIHIDGQVRPDRDQLPAKIHLITRAFTDEEMRVINWNRSSKKWRDSLIRDLKMPPPGLVLLTSVASPVDLGTKNVDVKVPPSSGKRRSQPKSASSDAPKKNAGRAKVKERRPVQKQLPKRIFFPNL